MEKCINVSRETFINIDANEIRQSLPNTLNFVTVQYLHSYASKSIENRLRRWNFDLHVSGFWHFHAKTPRGTVGSEQVLNFYNSCVVQECRGISVILPETISDGGLTPTTDMDLLLATYRGRRHFTSGIYIMGKVIYEVQTRQHMLFFINVSRETFLLCIDFKLEICYTFGSVMIILFCK